MHFTTNRKSRHIGLSACLLVILFLGPSAIGHAAPTDKPKAGPENEVRVTLIYDNYTFKEGLKNDWGFGALVEYEGKQLLFDAGREAGIYQGNATQMGIDPVAIPLLFISHDHGDHTAGIPWITGLNPKIKCYLPTTLYKQMEDNNSLPAHAVAMEKHGKIAGAFYSTGDNFAAFREHGLVVKTADGGVLITGCGHPGAVEMVKRARNEMNIQVHTLIGGLHLMSKSAGDMAKIAEELKALGIKRICPTHCTGDNAIAALKAAFGEGYMPGGTGRVLLID